MIRDRVEQISSSASSGTGNLLLDTAVTARVSFATAYADNDKLYYLITQGSSWEVGEGTLITGSPKSLQRNRVIASSNGGSLVSFSAADKNVINVAPAEALGAMGGALRFATTAGSSTAYTASPLIPVASLKDGTQVIARIHTTNTGAATLQASSTAAKPIRKAGNIALAAGDLVAGSEMIFTYDLSNDVWQVSGIVLGGVTLVTGTTYTVLASDVGKLIRFTNASGCAVTLSIASAAGFTAPWYCEFVNQAAGTVTITPTTSTVDGAASLALTQNQSCMVYSDSTNYQTGGRGVGKATSNKGMLWGLTTANNGVDLVNDIDIGAGIARSDDDTTDLSLAATHVKQIDVAFAEYSVIGTASGGRDSGDNLTGAKWFHVYLIGGAGKNTQVFFSTNLAPTLPSGFTLKRRIASIWWSGSTIKKYIQRGPWFQWDVFPLDVNSTTLGTSATAFVMSTPLGVKTVCIMNVETTGGSTRSIALQSPNVSDQVANNAGASPLGNAGLQSSNNDHNQLMIETDTSSQIKASASAITTTLRIATTGWVDDLGRYN